MPKQHKKKTLETNHRSQVINNHSSFCPRCKGHTLTAGSFDLESQITSQSKPNPKICFTSISRNSKTPSTASFPRLHPFAIAIELRLVKGRALSLALRARSRSLRSTKLVAGCPSEALNRAKPRTSVFSTGDVGAGTVSPRKCEQLPEKLGLYMRTSRKPQNVQDDNHVEIHSPKSQSPASWHLRAEEITSSTR